MPGLLRDEAHDVGQDVSQGLRAQGGQGALKGLDHLAAAVPRAVDGVGAAPGAGATSVPETSVEAACTRGEEGFALGAYRIELIEKAQQAFESGAQVVALDYSFRVALL